MPRARRTGLGRRLLDELVDRSVRAGAQRLLLEVREDNAAARALYAARGFELSELVPPSGSDEQLRDHMVQKLPRRH